MSRPELPPGWRWEGENVHHAGSGWDCVPDPDGKWRGARWETFDTLADAIASYAERIAAWEAEVRRVAAGTAPQRDPQSVARDPRVDPQPGDVMRSTDERGEWRVFVVRELSVEDGGTVIFSEASATLCCERETQRIASWRDWPSDWTVEVLWPKP